MEYKYKDIYLGTEAKELLISGINKLHDAVVSTMGPNGKTVFITGADGKKYPTKDGVSVAKSIELQHPVENIGADMLKEAAIKTANIAGDGTTTSTCLATSFINNLKDFNHQEVNIAFDEIIPKVINELKKNSREFNKSQALYVASISANNDSKIGNIVHEAFNHSDIVKVEESSFYEDKLELVNGVRFDSTYFSDHFITNKKTNESELFNAKVLIVQEKIETFKNLELVLKNVVENNDSLLIIAEDISNNALRYIESNVINGFIKCCIIKTPGFSEHRANLIKDISKITGATPVSLRSGKLITKDCLGEIESFKANKTKTTIVLKDTSMLEDLKNELNSQKSLMEPEEFSLQNLQKRIDMLNSKISIIKVGGSNEFEMKERKDRYDDAVKAVECALEEGIVEGAGYALFKIQSKWLESENKENKLSSDEDINKSIYRCLLSPAIKILENKLNSSNCLEFNLEENMFEKNIIDPFKVTRIALENAVAVAKIILSTNSVVLDRYSWN